jgi:hypothetical protein
MATYKITNPKGEVYQIQAPDNASEADVLERFRTIQTAEDIKRYHNYGAGDIAKSALQHTPDSAGQFVRNTVQPILHPIETGTNLKNIGKGVLQKLNIVSGQDAEKYADAVGQFMVDRYGSVDAIKRTLATDPVGVLADVSALLSGGGAILRGAGMAGRIEGAVSAAGRVADPLWQVGKVAEGVGSRVVAPALGVTTGAGGEAIRTAARAGSEGGAAEAAFRAGQAGEVESVVAETRNAVDSLKKQASAEYNKYKVGLGQQSAVLDFSDVDKAVANAVKTFKPTGTNLPAVSLSERVDNLRSKIAQAVSEWKKLGPQYHTAEGFDALKQKIWDIGGDPAYGSAERRAVGEVYHAIKQTIVKQDPEYAKAMSEYETAMTRINEIQRELTGKADAPAGPALRKIMSTLRDNVNTNYGVRKKLLDVLAKNGAPNVAEKVAGAALQNWEPRGLARGVAGGEFAGSVLSAVAGEPRLAGGLFGAMAASSPRLVGETAFRAGQMQRVPTRAIARSSRLTDLYANGSVPMLPPAQ